MPRAYDIEIDGDVKVIKLRVGDSTEYLTLEEAADLGSSLSLAAHVPK